MPLRETSKAQSFWFQKLDFVLVCLLFKFETCIQSMILLTECACNTRCFVKLRFCFLFYLTLFLLFSTDTCDETTSFGSKLFVLQVRSFAFLPNICTSQLLNISKQGVIFYFSLTINVFHQVWKPSSSARPFMNVICNISPTLSHFVGEFRDDNPHVSGVVHFSHIIHILHSVVATSQEKSICTQHLSIFWLDLRPF